MGLSGGDVLYGFLFIFWITSWAINFSEDSNDDDDDFGGGILSPAFQGN